MHDKARTVLESAGWRPDRKFDVAPFRNAILDAGLPWFPKQEEFLASLGGIVTNEFRDAMNRRAWLSFDILSILRMFKREGPPPYFERYLAPNTDLPWSIIGLSSHKPVRARLTATDCPLFITGDGTTYGVLGEEYVLVGNSPVEAIDRICQGKLFMYYCFEDDDE